VPDLERDGASVRAFAKGLGISVTVARDPDAHPSLAHVHVISAIGHGPVATLDACVVGMDPDRRRALEDAAAMWLGLAGAPILSLLHGQPLLGARHFSGDAAWGVKDRHGFVGPVYARFAAEAIDLEALESAPLFAGVATLARGEGVHLAKVTLSAVRGRWHRILELDGHGAQREDDDFDAGVRAPASSCVASCFAVFFKAPGGSGSLERA
jgi:hypothetical protein